MLNSQVISDLIHHPWLQKCAAIGVFIVMAGGHYQLAHVAVSQNLESCEKCTPLKTLPDHKLWVGNISTDRANQTLLTYTGDPTQIVNIHFDKARLDNQSIANLRHFRPDLPSDPQPMDFKTIQNKNSSTFIRISQRTPGVLPNAIYFSRDSFDITQPNFKLKPVGLDLAVEIDQVSGNDSSTMSDSNVLQIGGWSTKLSGVPITIIPVNDANIALRFELPDWDSEKLFEPFTFINLNLNECGEIICALALGTTQVVEGAEKFDNLLCGASSSHKILLLESGQLAQGTCPSESKLTPLQLSSFKVGKKHVQVSVAGYAWTLINGETAMIDLIALIKVNPYLAALLAGIDGLVLAWIKRVFS